MSDREKVLKGLEHCTVWNVLHQCPTIDGEGCPYDDDCACTLQLMSDALEVLKEQKETPFTCSMCSKHTENGFCSRWKTNVKDDDYCSFGEGR